MKRLLAILPLAAGAASAQCVMCFRTAAAQQMERARVLNFGILIMLIPPILILAGFLFLAWRRNSVFADRNRYEQALQKPTAESTQMVRVAILVQKLFW